MKIAFKVPYLSISVFNEVDLPDFTVITGVNGAGKTHLLQAIEKGDITVAGIEPVYTAYFDYSNFRPQQESRVELNGLVSELQNAWNMFESRFRPGLKQWKSFLGSNYAKVIEIAEKKKVGLWYLEKSDAPSEDAYVGLAKYKEHLYGHVVSMRDYNQPIVRAIFSMLRNMSYVGDEIDQATFSDIYKPLDSVKDLVPIQLGKALWDYYIKYSRNRLFKLDAEELGIEHKFLTDAEFSARYGEKPWDVINRIMETFGNLEYRVNSPVGTDPFGPYQLKLIHLQRTELQIDFESLSSGEKVLMALVALIYKAGSDSYFPRLLLLDEVDASLHPSMIYRLLAVIQETFISRGLKVIMVTHSPTTIALVPEDSIFIMDKTGLDRVKKGSREQALTILTEGFITLNQGIRLFDQVSRKRLSIFSEGKNVKYLERALELLGKDLGDDVEVVSGIEDITNKDQLKLLFKFFVRVPHDRQVLFVWDSDVDASLQPGKNTTPYFLPHNPSNTRLTGGIENLFDEGLVFSGDFYRIQGYKPDGSPNQTLDKTKLENFLMRANDPSLFKNFHPFVDKVREILNSNAPIN